jgi:amidophosphoribosyltransferase
VTQALAPMKPSAKCVFEFIYFARPDQTWDGVNVHAVRQRLGEELAREFINGLDNGWPAAERRNGVETDKAGARVADVVIPVPDSSTPAAIGFARVSGIPYNDGFVKNRYVGRTFIEPTDSLVQAVKARVNESKMLLEEFAQCFVVVVHVQWHLQFPCRSARDARCV